DPQPSRNREDQLGMEGWAAGRIETHPYGPVPYRGRAWLDLRPRTGPIQREPRAVRDPRVGLPPSPGLLVCREWYSRSSEGAHDVREVRLADAPSSPDACEGTPAQAPCHHIQVYESSLQAPADPHCLLMKRP